MSNATEAKSGEIVKVDPAVVQMEKLIELYKPRMAGLLGKHISVEQMYQIALTALSRIPELRHCTGASILGSVMESSRLRLAPGVGSGGTWFIPRDNKNINAKECTLIVDYRAVILMMQRDAGVGTVIAEAVHAKDEFDYGIKNDGPHLHWHPAKGDRGAIHGYVAASWRKTDKELTGVIYKTVDEIKKNNMAKSTAAMKGQGPWANDPEWMFKKSVIRPLGKLNPGTNDDLSRAITLDERADLGLPQNLHLLADPTAKAISDEPTAKTYTPPPASATKGPDGEPFPAEKIAWARDAAGKQGIPAEQFDAWLAQQPGDEFAKAAAAEETWKQVAMKKLKAAEAFAVKKEEPAAKERTERIGVSGVASSEFEGEDATAIRDTSDPSLKYFTTNAEVIEQAKAIKGKADKTISVVVVDRVSGGKTFGWILTLA
jgi:phage RecT family recombinase